MPSYEVVSTDNEGSSTDHGITRLCMRVPLDYCCAHPLPLEQNKLFLPWNFNLFSAQVHRTKANKSEEN
jgi:hypothetical protein